MTITWQYTCHLSICNSLESQAVVCWWLLFSYWEDRGQRKREWEKEWDREWVRKRRERNERVKIAHIFSIPSYKVHSLMILHSFLNQRYGNQYRCSTGTREIDLHVHDTPTHLPKPATQWTATEQLGHLSNVSFTSSSQLLIILSGGAPPSSNWRSCEGMKEKEKREREQRRRGEDKRKIRSIRISFIYHNRYSFLFQRLGGIRWLTATYNYLSLVPL